MRRLTLTALLIVCPVGSPCQERPAETAAERTLLLASGGKALLPILRPSNAPPTPARGNAAAGDPAEELRTYLHRISGADFQIRTAQRNDTGIYVGRAAEFPWLKLDRKALEGLGPEGFVIRTDGRSLLLIGHAPHAVATLLHALGCRWFFPGDVWEVVPRRDTIRWSGERAEKPRFPIQRRIWYGYGAYAKCRADKAAWDRHNRMGGAVTVVIGHTWHGLDPEKDFAAHPEWFALVDGKRQASKPCYSHPRVIQRAIESARRAAERGRTMISMTPPDGLGYCECERCKKTAGVTETFRQKGALFGQRADGREINVTSETLFRMVGRVAASLAESHPKILVGCYAYSAYSHPPSFPLADNIFLQATTAYRRTPLSLVEQLRAFRKIGARSGIRDYWDVYQWSYDRPELMRYDAKNPDAAPRPAPMAPGRLARTLRMYAAEGVGSVNAEMSNNWGARGLAYYVGARLLWDPDHDVKALAADFYTRAFGPAATAMEHYYARWYGPSAVALDPTGAPAPARLSRASLVAAYRDLDDAAWLTSKRPGPRERVDHLRLYAHYLFLRLELERIAATGDAGAIVAAIRAETVFGARLMNTNLVHARPLIGKAFHRRFRKYEKHLAGRPEGLGKDGWGKGFRTVREDVPAREELKRLWAEDKSRLGL